MKTNWIEYAAGIVLIGCFAAGAWMFLLLWGTALKSYVDHMPFVQEPRE